MACLTINSVQRSGRRYFSFMASPPSWPSPDPMKAADTVFSKGTSHECDWVWYEEGYVPGTRKCMGLPKGGRPTSLLDARVAAELNEDIGNPATNNTPIARQVQALLKERNTCTDDRVSEIDKEILDIIYPYLSLNYDIDGGCGSIFTVLGRDRDEDGGKAAREKGVAVLRREEFHAR